MATVLQVFIFKNGEFVGTEMFVEREVIIGRDPTVADLVLDTDEISRAHAKLSHDGETVLVADLGSTNGVYVGGKKIETARVDRLDEITLGSTSLKVKLVSRNKGAAEPRSDATQVVQALPREGSVPRVESHAELRPEAKAAPARPTPKRADPKRVEPKRAEPGLRAAEAPIAAVAQSEATVLEKTTQARPEAKGGGLREVLWRVKSKVPRRKTERPALVLQGEGDATEVKGKPLLADESRSDSVPRRALATAPMDDDEEEVFVPSFSLVKQLVAEDAHATRARAERQAYVEVLTFRGDVVEDAVLLARGRSHHVGPRLGLLQRMKARDLPSRVRLVKHRRDGSLELRCRATAKGEITRDGKRQSIENLTASGGKGDVFTYRLASTDVADVHDGVRQYHVRTVFPPPYVEQHPPLKERLRPDPFYAKIYGGAAAGVLLVVMVFSLFMDTQTLARPVGEEFVEVALQTELELEEAPPPEPEPQPEPEPVQETPKPVPKKQQAAPNKRPKKGGTTPAPAGVLGLLSKRGSSAAPGPASALAAVSNLSASTVPGGSSGFKVSGLIGKTSTSDLSVGGGGGGLVTKGSELLRGGGGGAGRLSGQGTRQVGGLVQKVPQGMRQVGQGSLDRDEIQRVINKNIGKIQRCYERELLENPGLSGKVEVEWTVSTSGSVSSARQKFSSLGSTAAVSCILSEVKSWRFPQPKGGAVVVSYPFMFKSIGF